MKKKFDKILAVKVFFVSVIFLASLTIQDDSKKFEIIKIGVGVISAFILDYSKKDKSKTEEKKE